MPKQNSLSIFSDLPQQNCAQNFVLAPAFDPSKVSLELIETVGIIKNFGWAKNGGALGMHITGETNGAYR